MPGRRVHRPALLQGGPAVEAQVPRGEKYKEIHESTN